MPPSLTRVAEVVVPPGENPSKVGTFVQRVALDPAALAEVPEALRGTVEAAAARLVASADLALAVSMAGSPAGAKMLARLAPTDDEAVAWLLFGLVEAPTAPEVQRKPVVLPVMKACLFSGPG